MSNINDESTTKKCFVCNTPLSPNQTRCPVCDLRMSQGPSALSLAFGVSDRQIARWIGVLALLLSGYSIFVAWSRNINDDDPVGPGFSLVALLLENALLWGLPIWLVSDSPAGSSESTEFHAKIFWQTQLYVCASAVPVYLLFGTICSQIVPKGPFF